MIESTLSVDLSGKTQNSEETLKSVMASISIKISFYNSFLLFFFYKYHLQTSASTLDKHCILKIHCSIVLPVAPTSIILEPFVKC